MTGLENARKKQALPGTAVPELESLVAVSASDQHDLLRLLECLDNPDTQVQACQTLHQFAEYLEKQPAASLTIKSVEIPGAIQPVRLLLSPAVFSPEQWGRTFAEGLMKNPEMFYGKKVVELGTGSGWISLLLLLRTGVSEIMALDINPIAITLARLNCWLNGTTGDGTLILSQYGIPIVKALRFEESDLLAKALESNQRFDHVIGCIPQVLHPDEDGQPALKIRSSEEELYDLSNYCFQQGILEDRFGLPLIARALEESQLCLNPGGKVTLVLGGRPGPAAIEAMFNRRGFDCQLVWSRRIQQADDTDLASLVRLEQTHGIRFHFFMSRNSRQAVSAETAVQLLKKNQTVYHDLLVYQAVTRWETPTNLFVRNLHEMGLDSLRNELDFSRVTEEQVSFLSHFSADMLASKTIPYPHERGDIGLRAKLAKFLNLYCHYPILCDQLFIGPERSQLILMVLNMVTASADTILLSQSIASIYSSTAEQLQLKVVIGNDDLSELLQLVDVIQPVVVLISPSQLQHPSPLTLQALQDHAIKHPHCWYLIDDSAQFDISSDLNSNMTIRLAAQQRLPGNLIFVYGLIKNTVSPDLELSFLLNAPNKWIEGFDVGAELSYSRIAYPSQFYYEWLFDDLLSFPFPIQQNTVIDSTGNQADSKFSTNFLAAATDAVFSAKPVDPEQSDLIRLDYGEMEAPVPNALVKGLFKGFLENSPDRLEHLMLERVCSYFKSTRQVEVSTDKIVLSQGVFPLFGALLIALRKRLKRAPIVALPDGSYGPVYAALKYHGAIEQRIATDPANAFLLTADQLEKLEPKPDLLWLTQPNNPSGLFFHTDQIQAIAKTCADRDIYLLADEIFFLMSDFRLGASTPKYLSFSSALTGGAAKNIFITDGLSKTFAAGGMRCGFIICPDYVWAEHLRELVCSPPRSTLRAWDALYSAFIEPPPQSLNDHTIDKRETQLYMESLRKRLSSQRDELIALLKKHDLDDRIDSPYRGGFFVLARLAERYETLAKEAGLLVNPEQWARTPGWTRICFSLTPEKFQAAKAKLTDFLNNSR